VTPLDYLSTQRLLLAKQLLTDTTLPVTQVALASGFGSLRRFNAVFAQRYRMSPSALRKQAVAPRHGEPAAQLRLAYRPPYDIDGVLRFLALRALPGVESVDGSELRRTLRWTHQGKELHGWLQCGFEPQHNELRLAVAPALLPAVGAIMQRLRHALDLDADPARIAPSLRSLPRPPHPGLRVPGAIDGFETAARIVLGQQISVAAARTLAQRLVAEFGHEVHTPFAGLDRLFPTAADIAAADPARIGRLGIVRQRVAALQSLAREVADARIVLHPAAVLEPTLAALRALSASATGGAVDRAARAGLARRVRRVRRRRAARRCKTRDAPPRAQRIAEAWRPWRAYALMSLLATALEQPHEAQPYLVAQTRLQTPLGPITVAATASGLAGLVVRRPGPPPADAGCTTRSAAAPHRVGCSRAAALLAGPGGRHLQRAARSEGHAVSASGVARLARAAARPHVDLWRSGRGSNPRPPA
jgi:AraC family transcriptional regulator of adaptative response / DNA-3-methyladenine glycosylase II